MNNQRTIVVSIVLLLIVLNFSLQSFDFLSLTFNKCGFYVADLSCMDASAFIANKLGRFGINMLCIFILLKHFGGTTAYVLSFALILILLLGIDIFFALSGHSFLVQVHKIMNPLLYSPLLPIVYGGSAIYRKN